MTSFGCPRLQPPAIPDSSATIDERHQIHERFNRRHLFLGVVSSSIAYLNLNCNPNISVLAAEEGSEDSSIVAALKSLLDPNEKTKSGKLLPKDYLKSAREVVKTLRESLSEDSKDVAKFRRTADAAKESIKEFLSSWRGQKSVVNEESYVMIEKAIRSLAGFYSKSGPSASLPEIVKSEILNDLTAAEEFL